MSSVSLMGGECPSQLKIPTGEVVLNEFLDWKEEDFYSHPISHGTYARASNKIAPIILAGHKIRTGTDAYTYGTCENETITTTSHNLKFVYHHTAIFITKKLHIRHYICEIHQKYQSTNDHYFHHRTFSKNKRVGTTTSPPQGITMDFNTAIQKKVFNLNKSLLQSADVKSGSQSNQHSGG